MKKKRLSEDILGSVSRYFSPAVHLIQGCHYGGTFFPSSLRGHSWSSCSPHLFLSAEECLDRCEFGWVDKHAWLSPSGDPKGGLLLAMVRLVYTACDSGEGNGNPLQYSCLENPMEGCSPWGHWESEMTEQLHFHVLEQEMAAHSNVFAWRSQGQGSLVGCHLWGRTELDMTEAT